MGSTAGTLSTVLKKCLVEGYGSKSPAGWTTELTSGNNCILRNSPTNGSGRYFRIKDDGAQQLFNSGVYYIATLQGGSGYTDIDTMINPFPRTITGSNRHSDTYYGECVYKAQGGAWTVIADDATCYYIWHKSSSLGYYVTGFGDLLRVGNISNFPCAFIRGCGFRDGTNEVSNYYSGLGLFDKGLRGYLEYPITGGSDSTLLYMLGSKVNWSAVSAPARSANGEIMGHGFLYPSPITGGAAFEPVYVADDTNNVVRPADNKHVNREFDTFAQLRGAYRVLHRLHNYPVGDNPYRIGEVDDIVSYGGRDYLLLKDNGEHPVAFDITGPW